MKVNHILESIESESTKVNHELIWSYFFVERINKEKMFDYEVEEGPNDETDVYAKSKSGKFPDLKLQLTWALEKDFRPRKQIKELNFGTEIIFEAVSKKYEKYTKQGKGDLLKEIILIIQGELPDGWCDLVDDEKIKARIATYPFRGIYYITSPKSVSMLDGRAPVMRDGLVLCFKNAFEI